MARVQPSAGRQSGTRRPKVAGIGRSVASQRTTPTAQAINARSSTTVKPIVAASESVRLSTSPPASSTTTTATVCASSTHTNAPNTARNGAQTGTPTLGSTAAGGSAGTGAPSGSSGRDGGDPGCWKEGGTLVTGHFKRTRTVPGARRASG